MILSSLKYKKMVKYIFLDSFGLASFFDSLVQRKVLSWHEKRLIWYYKSEPTNPI